MILFKPKEHKRFLLHILNGHLTEKMENLRVIMAYFIISGLDVLDVLDTISEDYKKSIINWLYYLQNTNENSGGFQSGMTFNNISNCRSGNIAATYSALNILLTLGDDLDQVNKKAICNSLRLLQLPDGSFLGNKNGTENDMRFVYCAASICFILDDWSGMDVEKAVQFILNSISYDFGIGQGPSLESHGGSTYCAIAALVLTGQLHRMSQIQREGLKRWSMQLQGSGGGFRGRPNKIEDTCYSFWVGATLKMLGSYDSISHDPHINFILSTQHMSMGGLAKWCDYLPDPMHTYLGLAGLSLNKFEGLNEVMPSLNITQKAYIHLQKLHKRWRT